MNKIGYYDLFFDFLMFQSKRWVGVKKYCTIPKLVWWQSSRNFLKYWKKPEQSSYQERREKRTLVNKFSFFFASLWKKANYVLIPSSARYAWGIFKKRPTLFNNYNFVENDKLILNICRTRPETVIR
jgi:hypothetical protein